jgi:hypothetical protein
MTWVPIDGYPGYEIDANGDVRSWHPWRRPSPHTHARRKGKIGYFVVDLLDESRVKRTLYIHRLLALAFLGPAPEGADEVAHLNGVRDDNRLENLAWVSHAANMGHMVAHGTSRRHIIARKPEVLLRGNDHPGAKLTDDLVRELRQLHAGGMSINAIARKAGINHKTAACMLSGKTWAHVNEAVV